MQQLTKQWTPDLISSNTFMLTHQMGGAEKIIEISAIKGALACNAGILLASNSIEYAWEAEEVVNLATAAGKKTHFISLTTTTDSMGLNPFLSLTANAISLLFFGEDTIQAKILAEELAKETEPMTPQLVLKVLRENEDLYTDKELGLQPVIDCLEFVVNSGNMLNNSEASINVDLQAAINAGDVIILGAPDDDQYKATQTINFIHNYLLKPLYAQDQMRDNSDTPFYFVTSSDSALHTRFITNILAFGRKQKLHVCFSEYRSKKSDLEDLHAAYSNCHNKIWGVQKEILPHAPQLIGLLEITTPSDVNKILFIGAEHVKETLSLNLIPFKITYDKRNFDREGDYNHMSIEKEIIYAVDDNAACDVWERLHSDDQDGETNGIEKCEQQFDYPILQTAITFRMPDGPRMLYVDTVARIRAERNQDQFNGDFALSMDDTAKFFSESPDNISEWLKTNIKWDDIKNNTYILEERTSDNVMQSAWADASFKILGADKKQ